MLTVPPRSPGRFLWLGLGVETVVVGVAVVVAHFADVPLRSQLVWSWQDAGLGVLATFPILAYFVYSCKSAWPPLVRIRELLVDGMGPLFGPCKWWQLLVLAIAAGVGEELLFRGVLEPLIGRWHPWIGRVISALIFGLLHAITTVYFLFATFFGLYFSLLMTLAAQGPLVPPIIAHALYDFLAFLLIQRMWQARMADRADPLSATSYQEMVTSQDDDTDDEL